MLTILYTFVICPLVQLSEVICLFAYRLCGNFALAPVGLSLVVSAMIPPLYFIAEKWRGIIPDAKNPFAGAALQRGAPNGAFITTGKGSTITLDFQSDEWLHVHDDIFDPAHWTQWGTP